jgi:hypothetical protein
MLTPAARARATRAARHFHSRCAQPIVLAQRWDMSKKREYITKVLIGKNRHGISCVPPLEYAERFKRRVVAAIVEGRD